MTPLAKQPFDTVVAEHGARILRVCRAVLGPTADADDAWSETFLAALKAWPDFPDDGRVEAWLVTIAHRKAIDVTRARARRPIPVAEITETAPEPGPPDRSDELWEAVRSLPPKQRQAVAYHHLGGLRHAEVAELIGGSAASVRKAASDGIRALRTLLQDPKGA
ncbi:RNA polymerase sigma factor [Microlunatus parietis]|uniref:RNA polymerase sigma factor (Sigma-70 family) n=1 Tax=Microlunatus parietis TaxID=682979 RepID=A0A7Y9LFD8_9ACTN|nr:sigma-70 family RNA polymerase sigma factor [Microlunatus parietis]NYE74026.1 RNA polymerase sigma factor (sigma-70 family) [Microlunatus parietis]